MNNGVKILNGSVDKYISETIKSWMDRMQWIANHYNNGLQSFLCMKLQYRLDLSGKREQFRLTEELQERRNEL